MVAESVTARVHNGSPGGPGGPPAAADQHRDDARDVRRRLPQAGHARRRVRPRPPVALQVRSAFTREPGTLIDDQRSAREESIVAVIAGLTQAGADIATVSVIGAGRLPPGTAGTMRDVLAGEGIHAELVPTSPARLSCVVPAAEADRVACRLHQVFILAGPGRRYRPARREAGAVEHGWKERT
jgi:hypothetical protein